MRLRNKIMCLLMLLVVIAACSDSDQQADPDFIAKNTHVRFSPSNSPVVLVDEAHHNFLTKEGRYRAFSEVLASTGYTVRAGEEKFTLPYLKQADVLVIANALDRKRRNWQPPFGDALDDEEVAAVLKWVSSGGSLFLVVDHAPFPRVIKTLTTAFGIEFSNGHVGDALFKIDNRSLVAHSITKSHEFASPINQVKTFGGSAFQIPKNAQPLLMLGAQATSFVPDTPFKINADTLIKSMDGWYQGAVLEFGEGRVAIFSEGMMFTSQITLSNGKKYGLVSDGAEQNEAFLLNVMYWLSKEI